jgi:hypothetical protein
MLRIGRKPSIKKSDDKWGWSTPFFTTNGYCYVCLEEWKHMEAFQDGVPWLFFKMPDAKEVDRYLLSKVQTDKPFEGEMSEELKQVTKIIENLLKYSGGSTVWEFNGLAPNKEYWLRNIVVFGDKTDPMRIWTWKDVVVFFFFRTICRVYNTIRRLL